MCKDFSKRITLGLATLVVGAALTACGSNSKESSENRPSQTEAKEAFSNPEVNNPSEAVKLLKDGNERFLEGNLANFDLGEDRRNELTNGQSPFAVIVACSDSRVVPEHMFDQGLGDLFVIRVAGNVLDHNEMASVEYAVANLNSPLVVVLGHESCGAVSATASALEDPQAESTVHLEELMSKIEPAVVDANEKNLSSEETLSEAIKLNVQNGVEQLKAESSVVSENLESGNLKVIGGTYSLSSGKVDFIEE